MEHWKSGVCRHFLANSTGKFRHFKNKISQISFEILSGVGKTSPRKFLSESNIESSTPGEKPSRADRAEITENELCDFLQKMYSLVLENCQADGSCSD